MKTNSAYPIASGRKQVPKAKQWRVFIDSRPIETLRFTSNQSEHVAKKFAADVYSVSLDRVAALEEDFVTAFERRLEGLQRRRLRPISYHEAGHAVLAHHLGACVTMLSTIPQMRYRGGDFETESDSMGRMSWAVPRAAPWLAGTRSRLEREACILLAGRTAESKFLGRRGWRVTPWDGDMQRVAALAIRSADDCSASFAEITERWKTATGEKVDALWSHIVDVASVLVDKREIAEAELRQLLRGVPVTAARSARIPGGG